MKHCMIDIETLGTRPGSVVAAIGSVIFGQDMPRSYFYSAIDIDSALEVGLKVDGDTLRWWMLDTNITARKALFEVAQPIHPALREFKHWIVENKPDYFWAHGATFDFPLLDAAYAAIGEKVPWDFRKVRDDRTLFSMVPGHTPLKRDAVNDIPHIAVHDADYQADCVEAALAMLPGYQR